MVWLPVGELSLRIYSAVSIRQNTGVCLQAYYVKLYYGRVSETVATYKHYFSRFY